MSLTMMIEERIKQLKSERDVHISIKLKAEYKIDEITKDIENSYEELKEELIKQQWKVAG